MIYDKYTLLINPYFVYSTFQLHIGNTLRSPLPPVPHPLNTHKHTQPKLLLKVCVEEMSTKRRRNLKREIVHHAADS